MPDEGRVWLTSTCNKPGSNVENKNNVVLSIIKFLDINYVAFYSSTAVDLNHLMNGWIRNISIQLGGFLTLATVLTLPMLLASAFKHPWMGLIS